MRLLLARCVFLYTPGSQLQLQLAYNYKPSNIFFNLSVQYAVDSATIDTVRLEDFLIQVTKTFPVEFGFVCDVL